MHGHPTAAAMLLSSSHSRLIDSYADASRKVTCSIELMLSGDRPDSAKRSLSSAAIALSKTRGVLRPRFQIIEPCCFGCVQVGRKVSPHCGGAV
jgi:hypothetical protein